MEVKITKIAVVLGPTISRVLRHRRMNGYRNMSATNSALPKLRPKRAIVANPDTEQKNSILSKLGHQSDSVGWQVQLPKLHSPSYQCPICSQYFYSKGSRKNHEKNNHPLPSSSTSLLVVPAHSRTEDSVSTAQEKFLVSLNLYKLNKNQMSIADRVVHHKNLLKGLKMFGKKTGLYACNHCEYKTNRIYILWAHISVNHINPDSDTRSSSFCFLCDRVLSKRTTLLKHIDTCTEKHEENNELSSSSIKKFVCNFCNANYFESLSQLEKHLWNHVTS